jgi:hypothetical protein
MALMPTASALLRPPVPGRFDASELAGLPEPVTRFLRASIEPGTPLWTSARVRMRGSIKLGWWLPFLSRELLAPRHGFSWSARVAGLITGEDHFLLGEGAMDWRVAGILPVVRASGDDVARSSAARAGSEALWLPTVLLPALGATWSVIDDTRVSVHINVHTIDLDIRYTLGPDGRVRGFELDRWGDPDRTGTWGMHPFGGEVDDHRTFAGVTIPCRGRLGWFFGTPRWPDGEFFRYQLTSLEPVRSAAPRDARTGLA